MSTSSADAQRALRDAFGAFPSGVAAIAALDDAARPQGLAASSFTSVSLDPPLVSVCIAQSSESWPMLSARPRIGVSVLAASQGRLAAALASKTMPRFADVDWRSNDDGAVFVVGAALWLDCTIADLLPGGDHDIVLLRVMSFDLYRGVEPLVFHRSQFRELAI